MTDALVRSESFCATLSSDKSKIGHTVCVNKDMSDTLRGSALTIYAVALTTRVCPLVSRIEPRRAYTVPSRVHWLIPRWVSSDDRAVVR